MLELILRSCDWRLLKVYSILVPRVCFPGDKPEKQETEETNEISKRFYS